MAMEWKHIGEAQARQHRLYGIGGWLLVFLIVDVLGILISWGLLQNFSRDTGASVSELWALGEPTVSNYIVMLGFGILTPLVNMMITVLKVRWFRVGSITIVWFNTFVAILCAAAGIGPNTLNSVIGGMLGALIWTAYFHKSARVRVTFEHMIWAEQESPSTELAGATGVAATPMTGPTEPVAVQVEPHESVWEQALAEHDGPARRGGVYAKCFAQTGGDESATKAMYIKLRAVEIQAELAAASGSAS